MRTTGIPVAETFMAKGLLDYEDPHALGTVGLQSRDYAMAGFEDADVVIAVGYDLVEHAPEHWNPRGDKRIVMIDTVAAEIDEFFIPEVELVGDIAHVLARLAASCSRASRVPRTSLPPARARRSARFAEARDDDHFPMRPPRVLCRHPRRARPRRPAGLRRRACTSSGSAGCSPPMSPGTVLIANGLAGMGFALPTAIAAKLVAPRRSVVTVNGDGGFLMNCQELETASACRPRSSTWSGRTASSARSRGSRTRSSAATSASTSATRTSSSWPSRSALPAWRCASAGEFSQRPGRGAGARGPSVIVVPIDYSIDVAISRELGAETVAT